MENSNLLSTFDILEIETHIHYGKMIMYRTRPDIVMELFKGRQLSVLLCMIMKKSTPVFNEIIEYVKQISISEYLQLCPVKKCWFKVANVYDTFKKCCLIKQHFLNQVQSENSIGSEGIKFNRKITRNG